MTDKQIIINGVDVSGCERIIFNKIYGYVCNCEEDTHLISSCKYRPDCHFKQLARKTQECENWKETANQYAKNEEYYKSQVDKYKAENKEAEQECEALQMSDNEAREIIAELKAECRELKEKVKELNQGWIDCDKERNLQEANSEFRQRVINRYKQTLTEIKEISEENIRISESEGLNGVYRRGLAEQILQKIREVSDDRQEQS